MNKSEFIIWLYEEKDRLDEKLHKDHVEGKALDNLAYYQHGTHQGDIYYISHLHLAGYY